MGEAVHGDRDVPEIDTSVAHASRVYDFFLGGTTNFEVDRQAAGFLADAIGGLDVACAHVKGNRDFRSTPPSPASPDPRRLEPR